ncbi:glycosyltransferase [Streptomyces albireticuli]|uniref:glycosyltransferase n=1 Tax=Streptomyces albireticuli TaxID=1940 RepID=UPI0036BA3A8B
MKIALLVHHSYGAGGTVRATTDLANALSTRHDVELVSVYRGADTPKLPPHRRVRLVPLIDVREDAPGSENDNELQHQPSAVLAGAEGSTRMFTRLADLRVTQYLQATDADVVIATRPGLIGYLARAAADRGPGPDDRGPAFLRLAHDHLTYDAHDPEVRAARDAAIARLDGFLTVTEQDATAYRARLPRPPRLVRCLPNVVPAPAVEPSDGTSRIVVAVGRLVPAKRFDLLIRAFARMSAERPGWSLRIYGRGPDRARLRALVEELGLSDRAFLMGPHPTTETEWAKAAIGVSASDAESFGLTIVDAMHCGVPVISTDCPVGPRELITHGVDGVLVPVGDEEALATALAELADDPARRADLGTAARATARSYTPDRVTERFERIVQELRPELLPPPPAPRPTTDAKAAPPPALALRRTAARIVRPLRRKPEPPAPAPAPAPAAPAPLKPLRPRAAARATPDGGLAVRLPRAGLAGDHLTLVAQLRGTDGTAPGERVELPLHRPTSGKGPYTAGLDRAATPLAEGRWDFYVERADDRTRARVRSTLVEQARLLNLTLAADASRVTAWVPYTTAAGSLTLRTWHRPAHAELDAIHVGTDSLTVAATLHGAAGPLPAHAPVTLVAVSPLDSAYDIELPAAVQDARRVRAALPYPLLLGRRGTARDIWPLRLRLAPGGPLVPLGRLAGDSVDRKRTDVHPARTLEHAIRGPVAVRPVFDPENDLTLDVRDVTQATM